MPTDRRERELAVKRMLGDHKIVDAKKPFRCSVLENDLRRAVPGDPYNCALAVTIGRYTGVKAIAIFHTIAYIPFDKKGDG